MPAVADLENAVQRHGAPSDCPPAVPPVSGHMTAAPASADPSQPPEVVSLSPVEETIGHVDPRAPGGTAANARTRAPDAARAVSVAVVGSLGGLGDFLSVVTHPLVSIAKLLAGQGGRGGQRRQ